MANILVIDDSRVILDMMSAILEGAGHQVTVSENGQEALQAAKTSRFDLIFSDINMPKMSGITLLGELKKLANNEFTPVVMVTTESAQYRKDKAKSLGAAGWLEKPISQERV
ncbi:MAG: response regulator, partial [Thioalkalispiraceae bacterium]